MAEINSCPKTLRTRSILSTSDAARDSTSPSVSPRSSSPALNCSIQYRTSRTSQCKGVWDGYKTKEEFMTMHLR